jgi:hypothetical protein
MTPMPNYMKNTGKTADNEQVFRDPMSNDCMVDVKSSAGDVIRLTFTSFDRSEGYLSIECENSPCNDPAKVFSNIDREDIEHIADYTETPTTNEDLNKIQRVVKALFSLY